MEKSLKQSLQDSVGFLPKDPVSWLYVARGLYKKKEYRHVIEAVGHCLRNEKTAKEAQHLLAFSLLYIGGKESETAGAFMKSINIGNDSDWQPLIELFFDFPDLKL